MTSPFVVTGAYFGLLVGAYFGLLMMTITIRVKVSYYVVIKCQNAASHRYQL